MTTVAGPRDDWHRLVHELVPGAELLIDMLLLAAASAVVLWPLCA